MDYGIAKHIEQNYPNAKFSEVKYASTSGGIIKIDYSNENAIAILYHNIYWVNNGTGTIFEFRDQFNNTLFWQYDNTNPATGDSTWAPIPLIRKGSLLSINCIDINTFSVSYQYLMLDKDHE